MRHRNSLLLASTLLLSFFNTVQAANIVASLDRSHIFIDESFRLVLEADDSVDDDPDFSPLNKDFEILSQSKSTNMSFVNGSYSRKGVWSLELMAKRIGALTIPSVSFGKDHSPALRIQIKDPAISKQQPTKNEDVYLQLEIEEDKAWVQSQVIINVRLFSRISMNNLRSSELETNDPDAIIKQLGNARSYEAFREGVRYAVHEIRYAVFPQHSGKLEIKPMVFEGRVNSGRARSFMDQFMKAGERKRVRSNSVSIEVQAKPANLKLSDWLPAKGITLSEQWSEDVTQLKNGEPVTRTITINAHGMMAENLPDLGTTEIDKLKQYPDKAVLENNVTDQGISSSKQIKVALIPTRSGGFKLPAIAIPWWNTTMGKQEVAVLPEKLIRARGEIAKTTPITPTNTDKPAKIIEDKASSLTSPAQVSHMGYWPWLSLILAMGWLATLFALFRKKTAVTMVKAMPDQSSLRVLEKAVHKHGSNNDAQQTKDALLSWARARWPDLAINNLIEISQHVPAELAAEIHNLNTALYSSNADQWQGDALLQNFKNFRQKKTPQSHNDDQSLEPLYK
ncbi:MAG: protein BatD [Gammaproteobacteria bacterium]|nr:protein BatD [Gammaproteobacteria bacterium]MCK5262601.1 protein BatD [Gammaproteobacteria bacterium]